MQYLGDIASGTTIRGSFNTRTAAGVPITLGGSPVLSVYKDGGTTETTTGVTLTVDFDSRTGHHVFAIATSDAFYTTGSDYRVVITTGTVDGTSVVGTEVGSFSIQNRATGSGGGLDAAGVRAAIGLASANLDTQLADIPTVSEFNARSLPSADYFIVSDYTAPPSAATNAAAVRTELATELARVDAAISSRLASVSYTAPANSDIAAIKAVADKLDTAMVLDGAVYQFTINALENAPSGSGLDAAGIRAALGLASANLDAQLADLPTVSEFNARTLPSADYFVVSDYTAPDATKLIDVWRRLGLDPANPLVNTATLISAGATLQIDVSQTSTTVTTTRQP